MPVLKHKAPIFMTTLRDHGWASARLKVGGNTAKLAAKYLAKLQDPEDRAWLVLVFDIPDGMLKTDIQLLYLKYKQEMRDSSTALLGKLSARARRPGDN